MTIYITGYCILYPVLVLLGTTILFSKIDIDDSENTWLSYWVYPSKSWFHTKYSGSARERSVFVIILLNQSISMSDSNYFS